LGYAVMVFEILGGLALVAGLWTRYLAILFAIELLGAALFAHASNGWVFSNSGGGWEYPVFWAIALVALALLGDGAYAMRKQVK
jgi:putative oxidoreductase